MLMPVCRFCQYENFLLRVLLKLEVFLTWVTRYIIFLLLDQTRQNGVEFIKAMSSKSNSLASTPVSTSLIEMIVVLS